MTRAELRRRALNALNDSPDTPVYFTTAGVNQSLEEGFERLTEIVPAVRKTVYVPRREGQHWYSVHELGESIQAPWRIWLPDLKRRLTVVELNDLDARHELWMTIQGDPYWWYPIDWRTFGVWPAPSAGGGWFQIDYYAWGGALPERQDITDIELVDQEALTLYAECEGYLRQWDAQRAIRRWGQVVERTGDAVASADLNRLHARDYVRSSRPAATRDEPYGANL